MKRIGFFAAAFVFAAVLSASAWAQATAATKIAVIDSTSFALEKDGITKFVNAVKQINTEFAPKDKELEGIENRIRKLAEEIKAATSNANVPVNEAALQSKNDEGERLQREYAFKKKEFEEAVNKRSQEVLGPIQTDIAKAIQEYSTSKGYSVVFDLSRIAGNGVLIAMDPKADITKEFIAYYNTRPATAATASKPN